MRIQLRNAFFGLAALSVVVLVGVGCRTPVRDIDAKCSSAVLQDEFDTARELIAAGANVNAVGDDLMTTLHFAAGGGDVRATRFLIDVGADLDVRNDRGHTPLILAAQFGRLETTRMLVEAGADPTLEDYSGDTALERARAEDHPEVVAYLESLRQRLQARADES